MKVRVFEPWYNKGHRTLLRAFAEGIPGAEVCDVRQYQECDDAVIFDMVKDAYEPTQTKAEIIRRHRGGLLVVEMGYVNRGAGGYYSIGWNGINGGADFRNADMPGDRWRGLGVDLKPSRIPGANTYVVVCGQVPWDVSVQNFAHIKWCRETVEWFLERNVRVCLRPHPKVVNRGVGHGVDAGLISRRDLEVDLMNALSFVTFNSNCGVDAVIDGVPTVAVDRGSMVYGLAHRTIEDYQQIIADQRRQQWAHNLAYCQWTINEMRAGLPWRHLSR